MTLKKGEMRWRRVGVGAWLYEFNFRANEKGILRIVDSFRRNHRRGVDTLRLSTHDVLVYIHSMRFKRRFLTKKQVKKTEMVARAPGHVVVIQDLPHFGHGWAVVYGKRARG